MATLPSLVVSAVTTFDGKALKKGEKSILAFAKKAGAALGLAGATKAVIHFGVAAAKAFIADEKAASRLAVSVKNLGIAFETPRIERYISEISAMSGVTDDQLRPAMQKLLQTTGSVTKSQELLTQALDISRGSGVDYETVVNDLSMAYVGNTKGLNKYGLGLTKAELKTMKFADVQAKFAATFKGSNAAYLDTYAGKFELISTAAGEATDKIGGALVESLISAFAAGDPIEFVHKIEDLASKIANMVASVVFGFKKLYLLTSDEAILRSFNPFDGYTDQIYKTINAQEAAFKASFNRIKIGYLGSMPVGIYTSSADMAKAKKLEVDALNNAKRLAALQSKGITDAKKKAALDKAAGVLDITRIGIAAALKGQISDADKLSLALQLALLDKNDALATTLAAKLEAAVKANAQLQKDLLATTEAPNPYRNWKIPDDLLAYTAATLGVSVETVTNAPQTIGTGRTDATQELIDALIAAAAAQGKADAAQAAASGGDTYVSVKVGEEDLVAIITSSQTNQSLSGSFNQINRGNFKGAVAT